ncbi:MAG: PIN domain-containing protein [Bacillota bacterium]
MRALLDTNILIHREAGKIVNEEIGTLFNWLDRLHYEKCIHQRSIEELEKHNNPQVVKTIQTKIKNYNTLKTEAPESEAIALIRKKYDNTDNDRIDTSLLKEVFSNRVDYLITEDRKIHEKALDLEISERVFTIDHFLEKVIAENPALSEYKVLSVRKEYFGNINISDPFFSSFKEDYVGFEKWFNKKSDEIAYICHSDTGNILAFLYIKKEDKDENYSDIKPSFSQKKRLKIGTFKVITNGYKLGERFLKIVFDNALINNVEEIYVTLFHSREEHDRLIGLLADWDFSLYGEKITQSGTEKVFVKDFRPRPDKKQPKKTYPFISMDRRYFIVPIYPEYHTELLPDSILNNEAPGDYVENEPHRNAIKKVYISRSFYRNLIPGDIILFYRTGGYYKAVISTIGVVESVIDGISNESEFIRLCRKRSVFTDQKLAEYWSYKARNGKWYKPFIVNFLYLYSLPKRLNMKKLIELGILADSNSAPRGFEQIELDKFKIILGASETNENFIIN